MHHSQLSLLFINQFIAPLSSPSDWLLMAPCQAG